MHKEFAGQQLFIKLRWCFRICNRIVVTVVLYFRGFLLVIFQWNRKALNCVLKFFIFQAQRWHQGNEHFGRSWLAGDIVGCMVDLNERTIMFTLNGEILLDDSGSELAFKDFEVGDGKF